MLPLPSNREEFLFGDIVAEPLRARPPSFEERLSSAEHDSRQQSWRTRGLTRRTKNHGTSLGEGTGTFRRNSLLCDLFHEIGRCQRTCVLCSNAPPWQEQMTEKKKKTIVERYALQTNTNTDGRVESCDTGQPTSDHEKQMLHNFT